MHTIKVARYDVDLGTWEEEIKPTFKAIADLFCCEIKQLRISICDVDQIAITAPSGEAVKMSHADFKEVV